jgi:hypothetical protein
LRARKSGNAAVIWLGNLTAPGLSLLVDPGAISLFDYLPRALPFVLALGLFGTVEARRGFR